MTSLFSCTSCGAQYAKWIGRCLECGKWSTIEKQEVDTVQSKSVAENSARLAEPLQSKTLEEIAIGQTERIKTGIAECDQTLGGGFVRGSFTLLAGEPGIGKSTLALQIAFRVPNALYVSGEESLEQIKLRADRLSDIHQGSEKTQFATATTVESVIATIGKQKPLLAVIDSIQTIRSENAPGEPGSISQVRACAGKLLECAKTTNTAILVIGHITKDGAVAGPKTLEHVVDTVLEFRGDAQRDIRLLRGTKNRFGSTDAVGMFAMNANGLSEVANPSELLLCERRATIPGSILTCILEGTRPLLVEIQALVSKTAFGYPVRKSSGFDLNRLHVLLAVLAKRAGLDLQSYDVHVNVVGGVTADEPAADLAVCLAVASAFKDKTLGNDLVCVGEVGLGGEVRGIRSLDKRAAECVTLGMKRLIAPKSDRPLDDSIRVIPVEHIKELIVQT